MSDGYNILSARGLQAFGTKEGRLKFYKTFFNKLLKHVKSKALPLPSCRRQGGRGSIAPSHS
jgi:hypothetical protein